VAGSRWTDDASVPRGATYDDRFARLAASGADVHGEATLVAALSPGLQVLDAGCGTGRIAIELAHRGFDVTGVDLDPVMLDAARTKAPALTWHQADLSELDLTTLGPATLGPATLGRAEGFDTVVLAGNVLIFVAPGTEARTVSCCADVLVPGGLLVAGFEVRPKGYQPHQFDDDAAAAGLELVDRWSTWDRQRWQTSDRYQVSVHRLPVG